MQKCLCIYTGTTNQQFFTQREHIIPYAIGGKNTLPLGYVSDEVNHKFSQMEEEFIHRYPLIAMNRQFFGPSGRKKHKRVEGITFVEKEKNGDLGLGYVSAGVPYTIAQIRLELTASNQIRKKGKFSLSLPMEYRSLSKPDIVKKFCNSIFALFEHSPRFNLISTEQEGMKNHLILGFAGNYLYMGYHEDLNKENVIQLGKDLIKLLKTAVSHHAFQQGKICCQKDYITGLYHYEFHLSVICCVYAKIAFNALAALTDQGFMQNPGFNPLRNAILTGNNIESMVRLLPENNLKGRNSINYIGKELNLGKFSHTIYFANIKEKLCCLICLYGTVLPVAVEMGKVQLPNRELDAYICDWQHQREGKFTDFLHEWAEKIT